MNPDLCAECATIQSKQGDTEGAFWWASMSIRVRAQWVLVNGNWTPRKNIMRA